MSRPDGFTANLVATVIAVATGGLMAFLIICIPLAGFVFWTIEAHRTVEGIFFFDVVVGTVLGILAILMAIALAVTIRERRAWERDQREREEEARRWKMQEREAALVQKLTELGLLEFGDDGALHRDEDSRHD